MELALLHGKRDNAPLSRSRVSCAVSIRLLVVEAATATRSLGAVSKF